MSIPSIPSLPNTSSHEPQIPPKIPNPNSNAPVPKEEPNITDTIADMQKQLDKIKSFNDSFSFKSKDSLFTQNNSASLYGKKKNNYRSPIRYTATGHLVSLSSASSASAVRGIIQNVTRNINNVKLSDDSESVKQTAIRKMKRILKKAQFKLTSLKGEENLRKQEQLARAMENNRQAAELAEQQQKKRRVRKSMDQCSVVDSEDIGRNAHNEYFENNSTYSYQAPSAPISVPGTAAPVLPAAAPVAAPVAGVGTGSISSAPMPAIASVDVSV